MLTDKPLEQLVSTPFSNPKWLELEAAVRRGDWRSIVAWQSFGKGSAPPPPTMGNLEAVFTGTYRDSWLDGYTMYGVVPGNSFRSKW